MDSKIRSSLKSLVADVHCRGRCVEYPLVISLSSNNFLAFSLNEMNSKYKSYFLKKNIFVVLYHYSIRLGIERTAVKDKVEMWFPKGSVIIYPKPN